MAQPFHHDEALYATWALAISSGQDVWLADTPIDKPPLFIYLVAGGMWLFGPSETVARIPSLLATTITIWLTYRLAKRWFDRPTALVAMWLVALSPYTILFAPTALTDPLLVTLMLAACLALSTDQPRWAGLWIGLACATKQQAVLFLPLWIGCGLIFAAHKRQSFLRLITSLAAVLLVLGLWELNRSAEVPSFLTHSANNYGGLRFDGPNILNRGAGFLELLWFGTGSTILNGLLGLGVIGLLIRPKGFWKPVRSWLLLTFCALFLLIHATFTFQVWDRYLLGIIPLLAIVGARGVLRIAYFVLRIVSPHFHALALFRPDRFPKPVRSSWLIIGLLVLIQLGPLNNVATGRYPLGSQSESMQGIRQMVSYLRYEAGANTTLHHRWLGTHWRFYLWGYPYDLQFWGSAAQLAEMAEAGQLIVFPSWRSETEARLALADVGLTLRERYCVHRADGTPSMLLYELIKVRFQNNRNVLDE